MLTSISLILSILLKSYWNQKGMLKLERDCSTFNSFEVLLEQGRFLLEFPYNIIRGLESYKAFVKGSDTVRITGASPPEAIQ